MEIRRLQQQCFDQAAQLGWHEGGLPGVPEQVALIHSEASEALEAYRNHEQTSWTDDSGKPQGIASEFADIVIRVCHYSHLMNIDLETEIARKLAFNLTRGHRHGGKVI